MYSLTWPVAEMENRQGIFHTTTIQTAKAQAQSHNAKILAGQKRTALEVGSQTDRLPGSHGHLRFQRASSHAREKPRLVASPIRFTHQSSFQDASEHSQRRAVDATPTSTLDPLLNLSHGVYGLPRDLVENFAALGIKTIYPWQKQCLLGPGLLRGEKSLVYTAPTGGGKSLVADVLMLKRVLADRDSKALLVLPYVALVQEKVRWLRNVVHDIVREQPQNAVPIDDKIWWRRPGADSVRVIGFIGGSKTKATWADFDIGVCTIEKV